MFLLDSLMISGIKWALQTTITAAEAEMNDDSALREQLLAAEMSREMGEISDAEFVEIEADLLGRIREIKERREGGSGPLAFGAGAEAIDKPDDSTFQVEASVSGDFYGPGDTPHTTVIDTEPVHESALAHLVDAHGLEQISVIDAEPRPRAVPKPAAGDRRPRRTAARRPSARRTKKSSTRSKLRK